MKHYTLFQELKKILGDSKVLCTRAECMSYSRDMSVYSAIPEAVVLPDSVYEVGKVMEFAAKERIPVTPRGAGTSVTGAVIPVCGGIVMDLSRMNRVRKINLTDRYAVVEPGVICDRLNAALLPNYLFPPDPGSSKVATIGGMISTNASGRRALKYGTTSDYVQAIEAVLPSGEIIRTGHRTPKASIGFDMTRLFTSSEGTMGVITEATLRILPKSQAVSICLAGFSSLEAAAETAVSLISERLPLSSCELMDCVSIQEFSKGVGYDFEGTAGMLIVEADGHASVVAETMDIIRKVCNRHGAIQICDIHEPAGQEKVWRLRNKLISALSPYTPDSRLIPMAEDIGVPVSKVPEAILRTRMLAQAHGVPIVLFGHAGDGNIHTTYVLNPRDPEAWGKAKCLAEDLSRLAIELGGTISAEHGIGLSKSPFIRQELGPAHNLMKKIKMLMDPSNIMNPGKMGFSDNPSALFDHFAFDIPIKHPEQLSSLGNHFSDADSLLCMMCGSCRSACPIFSITGQESDNARGKVQLSYALRTGVELSDDFVQKFYTCTGCAACEQNCPSGIKVTRLVHAARRQICKKGFIPPSVQAMINHAKNQNSPPSAALPPPLFEKERGLGGEFSPDVFIFPGCAAAKEEQLISSLLRILDIAHIRYFIDRQICCGFPLWQAGDEDAFKNRALQVAAAMKSANYSLILTLCPACLHAFCDLYPAIIPKWNLTAMSIPEYLNRLIQNKSLTLNKPMEKKLIYHDPCYLSRYRGIMNEPRNILNRIPGATLLEFPLSREKTVCCGGGGTLQVCDPDIAIRMASLRVTQAIETGAQILVTACPTCKAQFLKGLTRIESMGKTIQLFDIIDLVVDSILSEL